MSFGSCPILRTSESLHCIGRTLTSVTGPYTSTRTCLGWGASMGTWAAIFPLTRNRIPPSMQTTPRLSPSHSDSRSKKVSPTSDFWTRWATTNEVVLPASSSIKITCPLQHTHSLPSSVRSSTIVLGVGSFSVSHLFHLLTVSSGRPVTPIFIQPLESLSFLISI